MNFVIFTCIFWGVSFFLISVFYHKKKINIQYEFFDKNFSLIGKGMAILLVVTCHIGGDLGTKFLTPLGAIGVCLFLIFSGYGINESFLKNSTKFYWRKRIISVFFPYFIFEIIRILITGSDVTFVQFIKDVTCINPLSPFGWYLHYLLLCYLVYWLIRILPITNKYFIYSVFFISVVSFFLFRGNGLEAEQSLSFAVGILFSNSKEHLKIEKSTYINIKNAIFLFFIGTLFLGLKQTEVIRSSPEMIYNLFQLMIKLSYALFVLEFIMLFPYKKILNVFRTYGFISYELYLVHGMILYLFLPNNYLMIFAFLITSLSGSLLFYSLNLIVKKFLKVIFVGRPHESF